MVAGFALRNMSAMQKNGLKSARKRANLTQEHVAELLKVSPSQVSRWENGKDGIPSSRLRPMAVAYQASVEELFGEGEDAADEPTYAIELLPTTVGLGGGGTGEGEFRSISFDRSIIDDELRVTPDSLLAIQVEGDSMRPEFVSGDRLLIDKRKTSIAQPGAFCLWDGDGYVVKFLEKVYGSEPAKIRVISENQRYERSERLVDEVQIMGRVVWLGRKL